MAPFQNGKLLPRGKILEGNFRPKLKCARDQGEKSQNCRDHGREASVSEASKVMRFNADGILANDTRASRFR